MQYSLVGRYRDRARRIDHTIHVTAADFLVADCNDAVGVQAADMATGDSGVNRVDLAAGHELGLFDSTLYRLDGGLDVNDDAALQPARWMRTDADYFYRVLGGQLADDRDDFGCADIEPDDKLAVTSFSHRLSPP